MMVRFDISACNLFVLLLSTSAIVKVSSGAVERDIGDIRDVVEYRPFDFAGLERLKSKYEAAYKNQDLNYDELFEDSFLKELGENRNNFNSDSKFDEHETLIAEKLNDAPIFDEYEFDGEFDMNLPYGIQNVRRDLTARQARSFSFRKSKATFQSLCPSRRVVIPLETVSFDYRPDHYEEVTCYHHFRSSMDYAATDTNKVCGEAGFSCIQLNRTVYLTRRAKGTDCWESETRVVPAGCECMWPKHSFGDIITYH